jgi:hypothetical protein
VSGRRAGWLSVYLARLKGGDLHGRLGGQSMCEDLSKSIIFPRGGPPLLCCHHPPCSGPHVARHLSHLNLVDHWPPASPGAGNLHPLRRSCPASSWQHAHRARRKVPAGGHMSQLDRLRRPSKRMPCVNFRSESKSTLWSASRGPLVLQNCCHISFVQPHLTWLTTSSNGARFAPQL